MPWSIALCALFLAACSEGRDEPLGPQAGGAARLAVVLAPLQAAEVARVEAVVSAAGIDTLRQDLEVGADGVARGVIADIPVGVERRIDLSV
ncbi:MAG: hypothetical protein ABIL09_20515, partial [Gemmatimonadota bacterium]